MGAELSVPSVQREQSVHGDYGNVRKETFRISGLKLSYVHDFIALCGGRPALKNKTTSEVFEEFVQPLLALHSTHTGTHTHTQGGGLSLCEILSRQGHPAVGLHAQAYVIHAWQCMFTETVDALLQYFADQPEVVLYMDLFCAPHHTQAHTHAHNVFSFPDGGADPFKKISHATHAHTHVPHNTHHAHTNEAVLLDFDAWSLSVHTDAHHDDDHELFPTHALAQAQHHLAAHTHAQAHTPQTHAHTHTLAQALHRTQHVLSTVQRAVLVVCNWHHPLTLTRTWCLWELFLTHTLARTHGLSFSVAHAHTQRELLLTQLMHSSAQTLDRLQSLVNVSLSLCHTQRERDAFMSHIERRVGAHTVNTAVKELLAEYCVSLCEREVSALTVHTRTLAAHHTTPAHNRVKASSASTHNTHATQNALTPAHAAQSSLSHADRSLWLKLALASLYTRHNALAQAEPLLRECLVRLTAVTQQRETPAQAQALTKSAQKAVTQSAALPLTDTESSSQTTTDTQRDPQQRTQHSLTLTPSLANSLSLEVLSDLGSLYFAQSQHKRANSAFADCLKRRKRLLGDFHPHTLSAIHNVALSHFYLGQRDKAERMLCDCVEKMTHVLGEMHASTRACRENLRILLEEKREAALAAHTHREPHSHSQTHTRAHTRGSHSRPHTPAVPHTPVLERGESSSDDTFTHTHRALSHTSHTSRSSCASHSPTHTLLSSDEGESAAAAAPAVVCERCVDDSLFLECLQSVFGESEAAGKDNRENMSGREIPSSHALAQKHSHTYTHTQALTARNLRKRERERECVSALREPVSPSTTASTSSSAFEGDAFKRFKT